MAMEQLTNQLLGLKKCVIIFLHSSVSTWVCSLRIVAVAFSSLLKPVRMQAVQQRTNKDKTVSNPAENCVFSLDHIPHSKKLIEKIVCLFFKILRYTFTRQILPQ